MPQPRIGSDQFVKEMDYELIIAPGAVAEETDVTTVADSSGSLSGKYFTIDDPTTPYYVWLYIAAIAEVTDVICNASGTLTTGDYFLLDTPGTNYYVWYNVASGDGDPTVTDRTGIVVAVGAADADTVVASATQTAVNGGLDFSASVSTATVTITNATAGAVPDSVDGNTGFAVSTDTQGFDVSTNPAPGGTGIQATILRDDGANAVATAVQTAVALEGDFGASVNTNTVTVTNANTGLATDATAGDSGFTIDVTTPGNDGREFILTNFSFPTAVAGKAYVMVFVEGVKQIPGGSYDYTTVTPNTVTFNPGSLPTVANKVEFYGLT